jgi:predicted nucleic acid-binding protein
VIVVDASVVVELVLGTAAGSAIAGRIAQCSVLHAPHLLDVEVVQVVRRYERSGAVSAARALRAVSVLAQLDLERHSHEGLLRRVFDLRPNLTAYDAIYVALAEGLGLPLVTRDERLVDAPGVLATVEVL